MVPILPNLLLSKGYKVVGMVRRSSTVTFERIRHIQDQINIVQGDLHDQSSLVEIIEEYEPTEVYNLAAQSFVPTSWSQPVLTGEVTGLGVTQIAGSHPACQSQNSFLSGIHQ